MFYKLKQLFGNFSVIKVLDHFIENPYQEYHLREIARTLKISPSTAKAALNRLHKKKLVERREERNHVLYKANMGDLTFKYIKIAHNLAWIEDIHLVEMVLEHAPTTTSITLFGSYATGENDMESDMDLVVISGNKAKPASEVSEKTGRDVNILAYTPESWEKESRSNRPLYLEVITKGIVLYGERPVIE
ncbi:MAG: nucleotidyltransferase domain-containing protein [Candidatus Altiarchaeota archaeon]